MASEARLAQALGGRLMNVNRDLYIDREQTQVKHYILKKYLERFARIVGTFAESITYIDCFSGPWNVRSDVLEDSSFAIALDELRKARDTLTERGRTTQVRCMFLEKDPHAYARLRTFADQVRNAEIRTINGELRGHVGEILDFIQATRGRTFPFFFIDPTGWTGFEMDLIGPLLRRTPGEVLINFMTDYIRRFIDHPDQHTRQQFARLFGNEDVKDRIQGLSDPREREEVLFCT